MKPMSPTLRAVVVALLNLPAGCELRTTALLEASRISAGGFWIMVRNAPPEVLTCRKETKRLNFWSLGPEGEAMRADIVELTESLPVRSDRWRRGFASTESAAIDARRTEAEKQKVQLRDLLAFGDQVITGDPLRAIADLMDAAREVLAAKATSSRFRGAEVDLVVARALRAVVDAAVASRAELQSALEILS